MQTAINSLSQSEPVRAEDINWNPPRFSFRTPSRAFTYNELTQLSDVEEVLEALEHSERAGWVLDLIHDRAKLADALHLALAEVNRLQQRVRR